MTRERAIEIIENRFGIMDHCESRDLDDALNVAIEVLKTDAVPMVHGYWMQVGDYDSNDNCNFECSCCHAGDIHARSVIVPYCWQCGAKMDGKDEKHGTD